MVVGLCSWRGVVMVVDDVVVLSGAATFKNGGQGRRVFMLRVYVFCLMGVISTAVDWGVGRV